MLHQPLWWRWPGSTVLCDSYAHCVAPQLVAMRCQAHADHGGRAVWWAWSSLGAPGASTSGASTSGTTAPSTRGTSALRRSTPATSSSEFARANTTGILSLGAMCLAHISAEAHAIGKYETYWCCRFARGERHNFLKVYFTWTVVWLDYTPHIHERNLYPLLSFPYHPCRSASSPRVHPVNLHTCMLLYRS